MVGKLIVWRDRHHLTATYAAALAPEMAKRLDLSLTPADRDERALEIVATLSCKAMGSGQPMERSITLQMHDG